MRYCSSWRVFSNSNPPSESEELERRSLSRIFIKSIILAKRKLIPFHFGQNEMN